jgi:hypothetical protein
MTNGYGDTYRMNLLRDRNNYQAYRGICSYRGFSLTGCSTTGEVVMLRIKATDTMPEYYSLVSTSLRWGTTMYFLNDVFRSLNSTTLAGYENWYPFDMSCSVAMYINSGGFGLTATRRPQTLLARNLNAAPGGTNMIGALIPLTGDLADLGASYLAAYQIALSEVTNTPGMPPIQLLVKDTNRSFDGRGTTPTDVYPGCSGGARTGIQRRMRRLAGICRGPRDAAALQFFDRRASGHPE